MQKCVCVNGCVLVFLKWYETSSALKCVCIVANLLPFLFISIQLLHDYIAWHYCLYDSSDQGNCSNFHQPKWAAPETDEDQTLQAPEAAHGVKWPPTAGERPGGPPGQPELVRFFAYLNVFSLWHREATNTSDSFSICSSVRMMLIRSFVSTWSTESIREGTRWQTAPRRQAAWR